MLKCFENSIPIVILELDSGSNITQIDALKFNKRGKHGVPGRVFEKMKEKWSHLLFIDIIIRFVGKN